MSATRHLLSALVVFVSVSFVCLLGAPWARSSELDGAVDSFIANHVKAGLKLRFRNEAWSTFDRQTTPRDDVYDFFLVRARGYVDVTFDNVKFHVMGQGVQAVDFPTNGAFGPGALYFAASGADQDPGALYLAEATLEVRGLPADGFYIKLGRMGIKEGTEVLYGDPKFDWVKKVRLSERLIGNWDWVNIGRRYDGGSVGFTDEFINVNVLAVNVLQGGFDFDDGYKWLDNVVIVGGSVTLKRGVLVPATEFRVFNYYYYDNRDPAKALAGDNLKLNTLGGNAVGVYDVGGGQVDAMLWAAVQFGDFGTLDQMAYSIIAELGYQFVAYPWRPWIRVGVAYASGDDDPTDGDNNTFFNMVPTNHKFYGYMDSFALSNLIDYYAQIILAPAPRVKFIVDGHYFRLASGDEVWVAGSGPFNNDVFGYAFIAPAPGNTVDKNMGGELDLTLKYKPVKYAALDVGYSHFFGADGVSAVFEKKDHMDWFYVQAILNF